MLAYDNARLPQALVVAGQALGRQDLIDCGLETLDWIVAKQTSPEGRFRAVGTESFHRPYADPLQFDQQPLEAQATVDACLAAWRATGDARWVAEAERAYGWYLGHNDLDLPLATAADGGCFDGLMPTGLNRNQVRSRSWRCSWQVVRFRGFQRRPKAWQGHRAPSPDTIG